jgi:hypothetical protein
MVFPGAFGGLMSRETHALRWLVISALISACNPTLPPASAFLAGDGDASVDASDADASDLDAGLDGSVVVVPDGGTDGGVIVQIDAGTDGGIIVIVPDAGPVDAGPKPVGGGCSSNADCVDGNCYTQAPGGYCTQTCGNGGTCPTGSTCSLTLGGYCVQSCSATTDCRDGYSCQFGTCQAAYCRSDFQCSGGQVCDLNQGVCVFHLSCQTNVDCKAGQSCQGGTCNGTTAAACTSNSQCPSGETCGRTGVCSGGTAASPAAGQIGATCNGFGGGRCTQGPQPQCFGQNENFSGGYCTSSCQSDSQCGTSALCATLHDGNGQQVPLCLRSCGTNADCRPQYNCVSYSGKSFCLNQCVSNADCPNPLTQTCNVTTGLCSP